MEQQALVILFIGNELKDETAAKLCESISKDTFAHPEDVRMYKFDEENLAKMLAKQITLDHSAIPISQQPVESKLRMINTAAKALSKEFPLSDDTALVIHFGRNIPEIYGRIKYGKAIQHDVDTVNNIKILLDNENLGRKAVLIHRGTNNTLNIIGKIFNNYFDEKGNAK